eukprot:3820751-Pleurochrysis_carterae.AAC.4
MLELPSNISCSVLLQIAGKTIHFEKDMTSTVRFLGVIIVLIAVRVIRKGKCVLPYDFMQRCRLSTAMLLNFAWNSPWAQQPILGDVIWVRQLRKGATTLPATMRMA